MLRLVQDERNRAIWLGRLHDDWFPNRRNSEDVSAELPTVEVSLWWDFDEVDPGAYLEIHGRSVRRQAGPCVSPVRLRSAKTILEPRNKTEKLNRG